MEFTMISEREWDFAACENPECPGHPNNGGRPGIHYPKFTDGTHTLCCKCLEGWE